MKKIANRFLGFTAQQTLDYTQSLYEKKLVTYPRTDSRFLTEDMESMIPDLAGKMAAKFGYTRKMVIHPKEVINNSKVSDHHAIIPTVNVADTEFGELQSGEQKVLSLITARLLSALGDPAVRNEVDVEFTCADTVFRAKAKNIEDMVEQNDNSFDGVINNVKVEPAAGTLAIVQDDKKSVLEKLKEQSKQVQAPVPVSDRKPVPGCCFEREFQGW